MKTRKPFRQHGYFAGLASAVFLVLCLSVPQFERFHALGPANTGHEDLACSECHSSAPGTLRQQLQANFRFLIGMRDQPAAVGTLPVDNRVCLDCHDHSDDRHPVYRFLEPRFQEVRAEIQPHQCTSCHTEHQGGRVNRSPDYCFHCHRDLEIDGDPLDVSHRELVLRARWDSCIRCHDFHGSHEWEAPHRLDQMIPTQDISDYIDGGSNPFGELRTKPALRTRGES